MPLSRPPRQDEQAYYVDFAQARDDIILVLSIYLDEFGVGVVVAVNDGAIDISVFEAICIIMREIKVLCSECLDLRTFEDGGLDFPVATRTTVAMSETNQLPLEAFFAGYPLFLYNRTAGVSDEWRGLCKTYRWRAGDQEKLDAYERFKDALAHQFSALYGESYYEFEAWHALCKHMGIEPAPSATVPTFTNVAELDEYTRRTYKFFPIKNRHHGELAQVLLRRLNIVSRLAPMKSAGEKLANELKAQNAAEAKKRRAVAQEIDAILGTGNVKRARGDAKTTKTVATKASADTKRPNLTNKMMNEKEHSVAPQPPSTDKKVKIKIKDTPLQA
ncbi:hypothetical protein D9619_002229 [Psilocybe cf. subviscida]|uniref:Uncharacterized protein n=1 Tax=Psilocybe cf. subviscida TaxID=2480587 RepID=A0A8H5F350_9AGAR|nr:hypothetical protein D9619_002229 [Psilocybe cf. subviscida]